MIRPELSTVPNGFDPDETQLELPEIDLESGCFHVVHSGRFSLSDADCTIVPLVRALGIHFLPTGRNWSGPCGCICSVN